MLCRTHILADPSSFEEPLLDTTVSVVLDEHGNFVSVNQLGLGLPYTDKDVLGHCTAIARERSSLLYQRLLNIS